MLEYWVPKFPRAFSSSAQDGRHSRSSTMWWTWGAYDLTCSVCWMLVIHCELVASFKREVIWFAVSSAQACHACLSAVFLERLWAALSFSGKLSVLGNGEVTFWWMCKMPPVFLFSRRQAIGQPSSELGIRPRFTRSATSASWSWKKEEKFTY